MTYMTYEDYVASTYPDKCVVCGDRATQTCELCEQPVCRKHYLAEVCCETRDA